MTIDEVVSVFLDCHDIEDRDALGWSWWFMEERPAGQIGAIDTQTYLRKIFAIKLLLAAEHMTDDQLKAHVFLTESQSLSFYIDKGPSSIRGIFAEMQATPQIWTGVLSGNAVGKIPSLLVAFDKTLEARAERELRQVIASPVSQKKIDEFFLGAQKDFSQHAVFSALAGKHDFLRTDMTCPVSKDAPKSWGYNTVVSKEAFIADWPVHYMGLGGQYGSGMARAEDSHGFMALAGALPSWNKAIQKASDIPVFLTEAIQQRIAGGGKVTALITSLDIEEVSFMQQMEQFIPKWNRDCPKDDLPGFIGAFKIPGGKSIPVYRLLVDRKKNQKINGICIVDFEEIGEMVRLFPGETPAEKNVTRDCFHLEVIDLNAADEERQKILVGNPDWLQEQTDREKHLRSRALLRFYVRVDFRFKKTAGIKIMSAASEDKLINGGAE